MAKIGVYCIIFLLLSCSAAAIGISGDSPPPDRFIIFKPNLEVTYHFMIKDEAGRGVYPYVNENGAFSEYVTLSELRQIDNIWYAFEATLKFPEKIEKGGKYRILIGAAEGRPGSDKIGATARVQKPIYVYVLYSYKFIEAKFEAKDANINETADMALTVTSVSELDINSIKAKIDIKNSTGQLIETLYTEEKPLKSNAMETLTAKFDSRGHKPGPYHAYATLYWDENTTSLDDGFRIGNLEVDIIDYTKTFRIDSVEKFRLLIESEWNNLLKGVYGDVYVDGKYQFRTPPVDLNPWERKWIDAYWDNAGFGAGNHNITITLIYSDGPLEGRTTENGNITITEETGDREEPKTEFSEYITTTNLLILIVILLVIFNMIYLFKKNKTYKHKKR